MTTFLEPGAALLDLVDQGEVLVAFGVLDFIDPYGIDLAEHGWPITAFGAIPSDAVTKGAARTPPMPASPPDRSRSTGHGTPTPMTISG